MWIWFCCPFGVRMCRAQRIRCVIAACVCVTWVIKRKYDPDKQMAGIGAGHQEMGFQEKTHLALDRAMLS